MTPPIAYPASYTLNPFAIPTTLTAAGIGLLGLAVLIRERRSPVNILFFVMTLTAGEWLWAFHGCIARRTRAWRYGGPRPPIWVCR